MILSKTNYLVYRDCKKNAWLKIHRPNIYNASALSEFEKAIIQTGNEVEEYARKLFRKGILIEGRGEKAIEQTEKLLFRGRTPKEAQGSVPQVLFQPAFQKDNFFAAIDILEYDPESDSYIIYEVKASNETKESVHLHDLAFQYILLKNCGLKIKSANIMHLNPEYIRQGELSIMQLFATDDVTEKIQEMVEETEAQMNMALKYLSVESEPSGNCDCLYKGRSAHCTTFHYSNPEVPDYSIHDIARIGLSKAKLAELINREIYHIKDIPEDIKLSEIQQNQVDALLLNRVLIDKMKIRGELEALTYPLYFLDYETFPCAIPRFDGFSPYQQIPFQFSLHVLEGSDPKTNSGDRPLNSGGPTPESGSRGRTPSGIELKHFEYLHIDTDDPTRSFAEHLKKYIGPTGSVIVWNKKFEGKINEQVGERLPEYQPFMHDINSRLYDLMDVFSKQYYVHKGFKGSTSIKYVLPVLAPELSYKNLNIQEGGTASQAYNKIVLDGFTKNEKSKLAQDLKEYCKLDTYAMYAIWKELIK